MHAARTAFAIACLAIASSAFAQTPIRIYGPPTTLAAGAAYRVALAAPAAPTLAANQNGIDLAAGDYKVAVAAIDLAGGSTLPSGIATQAVAAGGHGRVSVSYATPAGAMKVRVWVSDVNGAAPDRYFDTINSGTYNIDTLVGATVAAPPTTASAYASSIGGTGNYDWFGRAALFQDGRLSDPGVAFGSEVGLGLYREGAGRMAASGALGVAAARVTATAAAGAVVVDAGSLRQSIYAVTIPRAAVACAAVTCDVTVATLPAKTFVLAAIADVTQAFACASVCTTSTLSAILGKTAGGSQYLASFDVDAAAATFGDAVSEIGASLKTGTTPAVALPPTALGDLGSWTAATTVTMRFTSGTGNFGDGSATNLSAGSVTVYLVTNRLQ